MTTLAECKAFADHAAGLMGWKYDAMSFSWSDGHKKVADSSWNPYTSLDDCQSLIEEVDRRGLWPQLYKVTIDCINIGSISTRGLLLLTADQLAPALVNVLESNQAARP